MKRPGAWASQCWRVSAEQAVGESLLPKVVAVDFTAPAAGGATDTGEIAVAAVAHGG